MKQDIVETTGDGIRVGSPYVKTCKKTGLTFAEKNMDGDISELYNSLKEIKTLGIKEKKIQEQVSKESCLIADNDKILLCKTKKFLFDRLIIYDKIKKVFIKK